MEKIIHTALSYIAKNSFSSFSLRTLSYDISVPLEDILKVIPSKERIFDVLHNHVNRYVEDCLPQEDMEDLPLKEIMLELFLLRLDALTPYKEVLKTISHTSEPKLLCLMKDIPHKAAIWSLTYAGYTQLRRVYTLLFAGGFYTFLRDTTEDHAQSMAFFNKWSMYL